MKRSIKVLIVEDDPNITELVSMYMDKLGFELLVADDGEAGLDLYYKERPDCIILDLMLPSIDGWEICKTIRIEDKDTPIIMLTGKGQSYDIIKGLEIGADDYIVKPFDPNELSARVKAALRRTVLKEEGMESLQFSNLLINRREFRVFCRKK
ncbi:MAG: response regulator transcription factor [Bacillus sp. (in: Bacteria)]|nr:response regulator transcription factor [Bacillus sp. (in: firmicutes)]